MTFRCSTILLCLFLFFASSHAGRVKKDTLEIVIDKKLQECFSNRNIECAAINVVRKDKQKPVRLRITFADNNTRAFLYDSLGLKSVIENKEYRGSKYSLRSAISYSNNLFIDLTDLPDGVYYLHVVTYENFKFLRLKIKSQSKKQRTTVGFAQVGLMNKAIQHL
jgi:hypothetical protein